MRRAPLAARPPPSPPTAARPSPPPPPLLPHDRAQRRRRIVPADSLVRHARVTDTSQTPLLAANDQTNTMSVLAGKDDGTLAAKVDSQTGSSAYGAALGDLNGDGKLDLVTANNMSDTVSVLLATGDGHFVPGADYPGASGSLDGAHPALCARSGRRGRRRRIGERVAWHATWKPELLPSSEENPPLRFRLQQRRYPTREARYRAQSGGYRLVGSRSTP